ncbi:hypothetical protein ACHAXS_009570, partial [Conticribra weissflogii]
STRRWGYSSFGVIGHFIYRKLYGNNFFKLPICVCNIILVFDEMKVKSPSTEKSINICLIQHSVENQTHRVS